MSILRLIFFGLLALAFTGCETPGIGAEEPTGVVGRPDKPAENHKNRGNLWYGVALQADRLDIVVRLWNPPFGTTRFFLPGAWAGRDDHADNLVIGEARSPKGPAFLTIDRGAGRVDVETRDVEWVELQYAVKLREEEADHFTPGYRSGVAILFGPTFLVLPSQQVLDATRDIPVEIHAPDPWNVMTTWAPVAEKPSSADDSIRVHGFVAPDGEGLRDAFLVCGSDLQMMAPGETPQTTVAFSPNFVGDRKAITALVGEVVGGYREVFGSLGPTRVFVDTTATVGGELGGVGRRGGFILKLPVDATASHEVALLAAHEALHLWNGHDLVPRSDDELATRWFKEGITHYLAIKFALRWGLITFDFAAEELARIGHNFMRNPLSRGLKGREMDRARFPYDQGALLALEVDASLARSSSGRIGVEDWVLALAEYTDGEPYTRHQITAALQGLAQGIDSDAPAIVRRHLERREVDLRALFHRADLHWLPPGSNRMARVIALDESNPTYTLLFGIQP